MEELDYYSLLEVERKADSDAIKKAYRKLALRWHPDKNPDNKDEAERRFKLVSEAYEVLSDPNKRQIYDAHGKEGLSNGHSAPSAYAASASSFPFGVFHFTDPMELFAEVFGSQIFDLFGPGFAHDTSRNHHNPRVDRNHCSFRDNRRRHNNPYESNRRTSAPVYQPQDILQNIGYGGGLLGGGLFGGLLGGMMGNPFAEMGGGFTSSTMFTSSSGLGGGAGSFGRSVSSETRIVNGQTVKKTTVRENNMETVTEEVNGRVVRHETRQCQGNPTSVYLSF